MREVPTTPEAWNAHITLMRETNDKKLHTELFKILKDDILSNLTKLKIRTRYDKS